MLRPRDLPRAASAAVSLRRRPSITCRCSGSARGFKPLICRTFPLEEIVEAHRYMESNRQMGKVVITV